MPRARHLLFRNADTRHCDILRDGIFALRTRRFGSVAECMVKRMQNYGKSLSLYHDLFDPGGGLRVEVKFSTVLRKARQTVTEETVLACIEDATTATTGVAFAEWERNDFDCNIQQIKPAEFDVLYYGLFFWDSIYIFRATRAQMDAAVIPGYSDRQHKGNTGEGQFHINPSTIQDHLDQKLHRVLSCDDLYQLLAGPIDNAQSEFAFIANNRPAGFVPWRGMSAPLN